MTARKKNIVPLFGVAFIVAILSTGIFYGLFVGKLNSASAPPAGAGKVWVSIKPLDRGTVLKAEDLKSVPWPQPPLPTGAVAKLEEASGKTLVSNLAANELLTEAHIASPKGGSLESGGLGIPAGQRAVSLQVQDSAGVVSLLKPGHRVDIQVVGTSPGATVQEPQLRTVLENMEVLTVPKDSVRGNGQIVTVLANPRDAIVLGLADSTAKIRISLRNPVDQKHENPGAIGLSALFRGSGPVSSSPSSSSQTAVQPKPAAVQQVQQSNQQPNQQAVQQQAQRQVQLVVRVARARWELLSPHILGVGQTGSPETLQVASFRPNESLETALAGQETITTSRLVSAKGRDTGLRWTQWEKSQSETPGSEPACGLDIQFSPHIETDGRVRVRVQPEVTWPTASGVSRRRLNTEVDVADGQSFLVRGFAGAADLPLLWEKLFARPSKDTGVHEMIVVVTPRIVSLKNGPAAD